MDTDALRHMTVLLTSDWRLRKNKSQTFYKQFNKPAKLKMTIFILIS